MTPGREAQLGVAHPEGPLTLAFECPKTIESYYASSWGFNGAQITNGVWTFTFNNYSTGLQLTKYNGGHGMLDFRNFEADTGKKVLAMAGNLFYHPYYKGPTSVFAPDLSVIGDAAFHSCFKIGHIELSPDLTSIGPTLFYACTSLTNLTPTILPKVKYIGKLAFGGKVPLRGDFEFASCATVAEEALYGIMATSIKLPACTKMEGSALRGCVSLTNVLINASTFIGQNHFYEDSALKTILFTNPEGVDAFPPNAFYKCNALTDIWYYGTNAPSSVGVKAFSVSSPYPYVHIRDNKDLDGWRSLATRIADTTGTASSALTDADKARSDYPGPVSTVGIKAENNNYFWIVKWPVNIKTLFLVR